MIGESCLLDTNILVYASDKDSPFHQKAKEIRDKANKGEIKACITPQILSEFYSAVTNPKNKNSISPAQAKKEIENYLEATAILKIFIKETTTRRMIELASEYGIRSQNIYDLQLVATMLDNGDRKIYTANDKDFKVFKEIEVINPFK